jgi:uncharacterized protein
MRLAKYLSAAALALATANLTGASVMAAQPMPATTNPTVAVGAQGTEEAMPDIATITAGLETRDPASAKAMEKNNRDFAKIMAVIQKYGVAPKDVQTNGVTVREDFDYSGDEAKSKGFVASNSVSIKARDLSKIGAMLAELGAAGANNISGPFFAIDDPEALTDKAREKAYDLAQRRALIYARKAGFKSVRLVSVNDGAADMAMPYMMDATAAGADAAAAAGEAMKMVTDAPIEPGVIQQSVYASFLFEMVP